MENIMDGLIMEDKINNISHEIRDITRYYCDSTPIDINKLESDTKVILNYMKKYKKNVQIQRVSSHSFSNMALLQDNCHKLIELNVHSEILNTMKVHCDDWKVNWLSLSAIWNLSRPNECREKFPIDIVKFIVDRLKKYDNSELVQETGLGALSNLVLNPLFRDKVTLKHMKIICNNMREFKYKQHVTIAGMGLLTNLAHKDSIAEDLVNYLECDIIPLIIEVMNNEYDLHELRNATAALSNVSNTDLFIYKLLSNCGIETIRRVHNIFMIENNQDNLNLINQIVRMINDDFDDILNNKLSSFHCMVLKDYKELVDIYLSDNKNNKHFNIDVVDNDNKTPLYYALENDNIRLIKKLVSYGASLENIDLTNKNEKIINIIKIGQAEFENGKTSHMKVIEESSKLITDVCSIIVEFENPVFYMENYYHKF
jgi:hypothetical protein